MGAVSRAWGALKKRPWVAFSLVVVLVVSGGVVAWTTLVPARPGADCSVLEKGSADEAAALAVACGSDVEVLAERTPWVTVHAQPSGLSRLTIQAMPSRTNVNGVWEDLNVEVSEEPRPMALGDGGGQARDGVAATRALDGDEGVAPGVGGMLPVAAPVFPMWFNPGGAAGAGLPLGVVQHDGAWVKLWFPLPLPVPEVDDRFLTYELGDGVRVQVAVATDGSGFRPVIEIDSPEAATWLAGALDDARSAQGLPGAGLQIPYRVETVEGLEVRGIDGVGFELVDAGDEVVFWSPPSLMWDSAADAAGGEAEDRIEFPLPGDRAVTMNVDVVPAANATTVVLVTPDEAMVSAADTVWPIRVDPTLGARTPAEWIAIRTGGYTSPIYKWTDSSTRVGESMGYCSLSWSSICNTTFTSRLVWEFRDDSASNSLGSWLTTLAGSDITKASFTADPGQRGNCASTRTDAYKTYSITDTMRSWDTLKFLTYLSNVTAPQGDACSDSGVTREWNVLSAVKDAADGDAESVNIGLKANNESSSAGYKTYKGSTARLIIEFNRTPVVDGSTVKMSSPNRACVTGANRPVISDSTPTFSAKMSDPDGGNVYGRFQVIDVAANTVVYQSGLSAAKSSGSTFTQTVSSGKLVSGRVYAYQARASDGVRASAWSAASCQFTIDVTKPAGPSITPVRTGVAAIYDEDVERGGVGMTGKFTFGRGASTDVVSFKYSVKDDQLGAKVTANATTGTATISYTPQAAGAYTMHVQSVDSAGNGSPVVTYSFDVAESKEDAIWMLDEGDDNVAADSSGKDPARDLTIFQSAWKPGPHELFGSRPGDFALGFDGINDNATSGPVVDTTGSFAISAFVQLNASKVGIGTDRYTVISQDGISGSAFALSYKPTCVDMTGGCWAFSMRDSDTPTATETVIQSTVPVTGGQWVHLVAEHNAVTNQLRLWTCAIGTPTSPLPADPVQNYVGRTATPWSSSGAFALGRGLVNGAPAQFWPGWVDNVRVFEGEVVSVNKIRRMCQGAEATDFETGLDALDPTTTVGE